MLIYFQKYFLKMLLYNMSILKIFWKYIFWPPPTEGMWISNLLFNTTWWTYFQKYILKTTYFLHLYRHLYLKNVLKMVNILKIFPRLMACIARLFWTMLRLCLVPEKCERKKIERKIGRKEKVKKMKIKFFTCLVIHRKFKGKKNYFLLFG